MSERTYPYKAWTLTVGFKPVEVLLVEPVNTYSSNDYGDVTDKGKYVALGDIFASQKSAIEGGWERVLKQEAKLAKVQATLDKKRAALTKAAV